jgi:hypothetical protein
MMLLCDGLERAFVGVVERFGMDPVACYDRERVIALYEQRDGATREEAIEFFEFNVLGAWAGDGTPCFLTRMTLDDVRERYDEAPDA